MSNITHKIQKNIDNIEVLKKQISQWRKLCIEDLFQSVKEFEKTPRLEVSIYYNHLFNDVKFSEILLDIYKSNADNAKMVILLISAIGNMIQRYNLSESQDMYEFMVENAYKKNVGPYVATHTALPQPTLWVKMKTDNLQKAKESLRVREGKCYTENIGVLEKKDRYVNGTVQSMIKQWMDTRDIDAVI